MTRDIKYRVWDKDLCKYVTGAEFGLARMEIKPDEEGGQIFSFSTLFPGRYTFEQHTGVKDKNGRDIFEGDILKWHFGGRDYFMVVSWRQDFCHFSVHFINGKFLDSTLKNDAEHEYEVVGNIHENGELLKGQAR